MNFLYENGELLQQSATLLLILALENGHSE